MTRTIIWLAGITVVWVLLWDSITVANVAAGVLVAAAVLITFPLPRVGPADGLQIRPWPLLKLGFVVVRDLVASNITVSLLILNPRAKISSRVVECPVSAESPAMLATMANIIALSPGMMAIQATNSPNTLLIHSLCLDDAAVRQRVNTLDRLVCAALQPVTHTAQGDIKPQPSAERTAHS